MSDLAKKLTLILIKAVCGHIEFVVQQVRSIDEEEARRQRSSRLNRI